jgi:hypothetical protein
VRPKLLVVLVASLVAASAVAQVSFDEPPMPVQRLFPLLSQKLGRQLLTTPQVENDVLYLRFKDRSADEVLAMISEITFGEWRQEGEAMRLVRPAQRLDRTAGRVEHAERARRLTASLGAMQTSAAAARPWSEQEAARLAHQYQQLIEASQQGSNHNFLERHLFSETPAGRALNDILHAVGVQTLASVPLHRRTVFALTPNRVQGPLPTSATEIVRRLVQQQASYSEAFGRLRKDDRSEYFFAVAGAPYLLGDPSLGAGEALLIVTPQATTTAVELRVFDTNGARILEATRSLTHPEQPLEDSEAAEPIFLSRLAEEFVSASRTFESGRLESGGRFAMVSANPAGGAPVRFEATPSPIAAPSLSSDLRTVLLNPDQRDPHELITHDVLRALTNGDVAALLEDDMVSSLSTQLAQTPKRQARQLLAAYNVRHQDGWTVVSPPLPYSSIRSNIDRAELAKLMQTLDTRKVVALDELARYAVATPRPLVRNGLDWVMTALINPSETSRLMEGLSSPGAVRIYGTLSPAQRTTLGAGKPVPFSHLTQQQRQWLLEDVLYGANQPMFAERFSNNLFSERTEMIPNGVPLDGYLTATVERKMAIQAFNAQLGTSMFLTSERYAMIRYQTETPDFAVGHKPAEFDRFRPAEEFAIALSFQLAPQLALSQNLRDFSVDASLQARDYASLPAVLQAEVDKSLGLLRSAMSGSRITIGGGGGGRVIPPTP